MHVDLKIVLRGFVGSALLGYAGTALVMPWEVGKLLLQIQWIPRYGETWSVEETVVLEEEVRGN